MKYVIPALFLSLAAVVAQARDNIQIAGSSTVLPFASVVAEEFGNSFSQYKTPTVGSGGSSGGIRQFCAGVGPGTIDIANSSRKIKDGEVKACAEKGVKNIIEVKIGYDGIVFASRRDSNSFTLTTDHIAAAAKGTAKTWNEIDPKLPKQEILLVIPASNHGTREVFEHKALGCKKECPLRKDGRIIEIAGDYTETLSRLNIDKNAVGVFGLSFYDSNRDKLQVATVNGVKPSAATIETGEYPISRPLYFYVKGDHIGVIPGLQEYAQFFASAAVSGVGSSLEKAGLVPLNDKERKEVLSNITSKKSL
jgi:phosphate transport system substrate-binding protein